jgi:hypothetical protein
MIDELLCSAVTIFGSSAVRSGPRKRSNALVGLGWIAPAAPGCRRLAAISSSSAAQKS